MTVAELIEKLSKMPKDAKVFYGSLESYKEEDKLPVFNLYSFDPVYYSELRSCRSALPTVNSVVENVVVFEYD